MGLEGHATPTKRLNGAPSHLIIIPPDSGIAFPENPRASNLYDTYSCLVSSKVRLPANFFFFFVSVTVLMQMLLILLSAETEFSPTLKGSLSCILNTTNERRK